MLITKDIEPEMTDHDAERPSSIILVHSSRDSLDAISSKSRYLRRNACNDSGTNGIWSSVDA